MTDHRYRYSIIPGGAVTDPSLEGRDLQVLCLLGRHTDKAGWCFRSQVKMAEEMRCGRSSVQRSLERLYAAGWVERKLRSRSGRDADPKRPHASHAYRVKMDRDLIPDEFEASDDGDEGCPPVGTSEPDSGHGGAQPCVGTGCPDIHGHQEGPSEGPPEEPERETRAREPRIPIRRFLLKYPSAGVDDKAKMTKAWDELPDDQLRPALDGVDPFIAELKRHGRTHTPPGWKYLQDRPWTLIQGGANAPKKPERIAFDCWSKEWWAVLFERLRHRRSVGFMLENAIRSGRRQDAVLAAEMPTEECIAALTAYPSDGDELRAWRPWFEARGVKLPQWSTRFWVFLPAPVPNANAPPASASSLMTEADLNEFAK